MVVFIPMVFNGGLVSTYFVVSHLLGLKNTIWALILPLAVSSFRSEEHTSELQSH